ncbi:MAG: recombinase family protein [Planctomycetota bacterium]
MIRPSFDLRKQYRVVIYARYSDPNQNPRSIDQQIDSINREIKRQNLPWTVVGIYEDSGLSGRKTRQRPGFQKLWRELRSGAVQADLIIVDTFERLSRADNNDELRNKLQRAGFLVLTADSQFTDPTSVAGEALSSQESIRAKTASRTKAHDVLRGKLDAVRLRHWPGGPPPFGFRLRTIFATVRGVEEIDHRELEPNPTTTWIVEYIYQLADERGFGICRIAKQLNADERIPNSMKPFHDTTIGKMLDNEIYRGVMIWNKHCTGIVNDTRILQPNPQSEWERIEDFCPAIISTERWERVRAIRAERGARIKRSRNSQPVASRKAIPTATGLALKYLLSGLVRCAHCHRAMVAGSHNHDLKGGKTKRYVRHHCPGARIGACSNHCTVPEDWLRQTIVDLICQRVFLIERVPTDEPNLNLLGLADLRTSATTLSENCAFQELVRQVQCSLELREAGRPERRQMLDTEQRECLESQQSYLVSLGKASLSANVRELVEKQLDGVTTRLVEIEHELSSDAVHLERISQIATPEAVAANLQRLSQILASNNVSAANLCLAQHIDTITCNSDGRIIVRTCKLGALAEMQDLLGEDINARTNLAEIERPAAFLGTPQRRPRRDTGAVFEEEDDANTANEFGNDPHRFEGLGPEWFWHDEFAIPVKLSWPEEHAIEVAQSRLAEPCGIAKLGKRFGKSKDTIRDALEIAKEQGVDATRIDGRKLQPHWPECHAEEVAEYFRQPNATMPDAVRQFKKSDTWIRKARRIGEARSAAQSTIIPLSQSDQSNSADDGLADDAA